MKKRILPIITGLCLTPSIVSIATSCNKSDDEGDITITFKCNQYGRLIGSTTIGIDKSTMWKDIANKPTPVANKNCAFACWFANDSIISDYFTFEEDTVVYATFGIEIDKYLIGVDRDKGLASIIAYTGANDNIEIPKKVVSPIDSKEYKLTSIGPYSFYNTEYLENVRIPNTIEEIGKSAFAYCTSIRNLSFNEPDADNIGLQTIGDFAFSNCSSIVSLQLPSSVKTIGNSSFSNMEKLEAFDFTKIKEHPSTLISLGDLAFSGCGLLQGLELPLTIKYIGDYAFQHCTVLLKLWLGGDKVEHIGKSICFGDNYLVEIRGLPGNPYYYCDYNKNCVVELATHKLLLATKTTIIDASLPAIEIIGEHAYCNTDYNFVIPDCITTIEEGAFLNCNDLTYLTIGKNVAHIAETAFWGCRNIKYIDFYPWFNELPDYNSQSWDAAMTKHGSFKVMRPLGDDYYTIVNLMKYKCPIFREWTFSHN